MATIAENLTLLKSTKAGIKAAIEAKGVSNVGDKFSDYPAKIASIPTGSSPTLRVKGLKFGYSSGGRAVQDNINAILGGPGIISDLNSVLRDTKIEAFTLDLSLATLTQQTIVDAMGMCYNSQMAYIRWPMQPSGGTTQLNATLMFSNCKGLSVNWPGWIQVTDARDMFAGGSFSDLNLTYLDLKTNDVSQAGIWAGGIFIGSTTYNLDFSPNLFNTSEDYNFSSLGDLQQFGYANLQDGSQGWTNMVDAMALEPHNSQTLILPTAWQEKIQQYNLESQLTSAWGSVTYQ